MSCQEKEIQCPQGSDNKNIDGKNIRKNRHKKLRRNRWILFGVCMAVFFTFNMSHEQAAQSNLKSTSLKIKDKSVEAAASVKKAQKKVKKLPKKPKPDKSAWNLLLVNKSHPIAKGYVPAITEVENGHFVDSRICQSLKNMLADARKEGLSPVICSSYRSEETQTELFEEEVNENLYQSATREEAEKKASTWVAPPGTGEHQLGLAVDLVSQSYQMLDKAQENTKEQQWLIKNCAKYGFILRYPTDKSAITGISYEPWHYRYVGEEAAKEIMGRGICLEEYLDGK